MKIFILINYFFKFNFIKKKIIKNTFFNFNKPQKINFIFEIKTINYIIY